MSIDKKYILAGAIASSIMLHTGMTTAFAATEYKVITADAVNFRSGPSTSYSIISTLSKGTKVEVISTTNNWSKIIYDGKIGYVSSEYLSKSIDLNDKTSTLETADKIISYAKGLLGKKYVWAKSGPSSFDCSGFTSYVFRNAAGVSLPRTSSAQSGYGRTVSKSNLQPGDLVFPHTGHVGIYVGGGNMIHSPSSGKTVSVTSINSSYYSARFVTAKRVL